MTMEEFLKAKLEAYKKKNPRFSLRRMAQLMDMPVGRLHEFMNGKRNVTPYYVDKIVLGLKLNRQERELVYSLVNQTPHIQKPSRVLQDDEIRLIRDWYHFAVLNIIKTEGFDSNEASIASRLGLSATQVRQSLELLEGMGLIRIEEGKIERTASRIVTSKDMPSYARREALKNAILKAADAVDEITPDFREMSSAVLAVDPADMEKARDLIRQFRTQFSSQVEKGTPKEVYCLNIQYFPLSMRQK